MNTSSWLRRLLVLVGLVLAAGLTLVWPPAPPSPTEGEIESSGRNTQANTLPPDGPPPTTEKETLGTKMATRAARQPDTVVAPTQKKSVLSSDKTHGTATLWESPAPRRAQPAKKESAEAPDHPALPERWMAQPNTAEAQRIEEVFARQQKHRLMSDATNQTAHLRRLAIEGAQEIVESCYARLRTVEPSRHGRLIVRWTLADEGSGTICTTADIDANVGLRQQEFVTCILQDMIGSRISASAPEKLTVEYPFFLTPPP
jgi:hypothetical protein